MKRWRDRPATADVLTVISGSPADKEEFNAIVENGRKLFANASISIASR